MKPIRTAFRFLTAIALAVLAVGCASTLLDKENVAVGAGFKVITPTKPDQVALLKKLPADKVTKINLQVVKIDAERNLLLVKGAVPGSENGQVVVRAAVKAAKAPVAAKAAK